MTETVGSSRQILAALEIARNLTEDEVGEVH
jgi:hypothetical protein